MAMVTKLEYDQFVRNVGEKIDDMQQSISKLTGDLAVALTSLEGQDIKLADAVDLRVTSIETRGNQFLSDTQVAVQRIEAKMEDLHNKTETSFTSLRGELEELIRCEMAKNICLGQEPLKGIITEGARWQLGW